MAETENRKGQLISGTFIGGGAGLTGETVTTSNIQTFTSVGTTTWINPGFGTKILVELWGGGGGGGFGANARGGGGGGTYNFALKSTWDFPGPQTVVVGAGGSAPGGQGGVSSFSELDIAARGGGGGSNIGGGGGGAGVYEQGVTSTTDGQGFGGFFLGGEGANVTALSTATPGTIYTGGGGGGGTPTSTVAAGGYSTFGGGGGGGSTPTIAGAGGTSIFGGAGGAGSTAGAGSAGTQPGGGGGGGATGGGAGGAGQVRVTVF